MRRFLDRVDLLSSRHLSRELDRYVDSPHGLINNVEVLEGMSEPSRPAFYSMILRHQLHKLVLYDFLRRNYPLGQYRRVIDGGGGTGVMSYLLSLTRDKVVYVEAHEPSYEFFSGLSFPGIECQKGSFLEYGFETGDLLIMSEVCYGLSRDELHVLFDRCSGGATEVLVVDSQWFGVLRLLKEAFVNSRHERQFEFGKRRSIGFFRSLASRRGYRLRVKRGPYQYVALHFETARKGQ